MMLEQESSLASSNITTKRMPQSPICANRLCGREGSNIDMSKTENCLLREELLGICKSAINDDLISKHFSCPDNLAGDPDLLESLARFFNSYFNPCVPVKTSHIATAPGAAGCLDALLYNICDPGDGLLIPGPYWNEFDFVNQARTSVQPIVVNLANHSETYETTFIPALADAMDNAACRVKALFLTNLHSPFGECYPQELLEACLKFCQERRIHFISEEVYALTAFSCAEMLDPIPFTSAMALNPMALGCDMSRIHTIWSISKDFGASGFRVGCTISQRNEDLVAGLAMTPNSQISSLSTVFATALLSSPTLPFLIALNSARLAESYMFITSFFNRHGIRYIPVYAGLNFFARLAPKAKSRVDESEAIIKLNEAGVSVSPGGNYHRMQREKGWLRLSFSIEQDQLREALARLESVLDL